MTVAEVRRIRRVIYGLYLVALVTTLSLWRAHEVTNAQARFLLGYGTLALFDIVGSWYIRRHADVAPMYQVEKGIAGFSFMLITVLGLGGYSSIYPWLAWTWIACFYLSKVVALEYILKRGIVQRVEYVRTEHGPEEVPTAEVMDRQMDTVFGWLRHGYGSEYRREVGKEALGYPANETWVREARVKRDMATVDGVEALELEDHRG